VTVKAGPEPIYEATATPDMATETRKQGGVLFMITNAADPGRAAADPMGTQRQLWEALRAGNVVCGFAALRE
jgi:hypothetical protein